MAASITARKNKKRNSKAPRGALFSWAGKGGLKSLDGACLHAKTVFMKDFLFTLLAWLFTLPIIIGAIAFAVYNADAVPIVINPFQDAVQMPVYVPVLTAIAFGFLFGSLMTWAGMGRLRAEKREQAKRIKTLEKELQAANTNTVTPHNYPLIPSSFLDKRSS